jgi:hypothetical protein
MGLKSSPKIGGIRPRKRFRYGSVIWKIGCKIAMPVIVLEEVVV